MTRLRQAALLAFFLHLLAGISMVVILRQGPWEASVSAQSERRQPVRLGETLLELVEDRSEGLRVERRPPIREPRRLEEALRIRQHVGRCPYFLARLVFEGFHRIGSPDREMPLPTRNSVSGCLKQP